MRQKRVIPESRNIDYHQKTHMGQPHNLVTLVQTLMKYVAKNAKCQHFTVESASTQDLFEMTLATISDPYH